MRSRTAGAIVTMSHPLVTGPGDIAERDARAGSRDRATRHRSDPAAFRRTRQPDRGGRAIPAPGDPAPRHTALVIPTRVRACARVGGQKTHWFRIEPGSRAGAEARSASGAN